MNRIKNSWPLFVTIVIGFFVFVKFLRPLETEDLWWHLKVGEWIVTNLQVPHYDMFPTGDQRSPWILTQWAGSGFIYLLYKIGGYEAMKIFRTLFFTGTILFFLRHAARRISFPAAVALTLLIIPPLFSRSNLRPDIFNYLFIQIFLLSLFSYQRSGQIKDLVLLPVLAVLWSNTHLGFFVYGIPLITIFLGANILSRLLNRGNVGQAFISLAKAKDLFLILLLSFAASAISPYGLEALIYPFKAFFRPDFININLALKTMEEVASPFTLGLDEGLWAIALLFMVAAVIFKKDTDNKLLHILLVGASFCLFLRGIRAGPFFALVSSYVIIEALQRPQAVTGPQTKAQKFFWMLLTAVLLTQAAFLAAQLNVKSGQVVINIRQDIHPMDNPHDALAFMRKEGLQGQVFNSDIFGGYILWNAYPQVRPYIDGRQNPAKFVIYLNILDDPKEHWPAVEDQFNIVLLDTQFDYTFDLITQLDLHKWQMIYLDHTSIIFVRRGVFTLSNDAAALERRLLAAKLTPQNTQVIHGLFGLQRDGIARIFEPKYVDSLNEAKTLLRLGFEDAGFDRLIQSARYAPHKSAELLKSYTTTH